ncbi:prepilin-type N-terminal cleavage/methylation domain-containing protein [Facklamia sp. DSM 111018]|uniref:Prepilin-type N-terminal cleavage/methylation domain-containing protein n=2 Tax=Facklamia lactis TaxID=2749967 RepID=A0ABS0LT88_9LACT|nr:competence type IV pilus minor pilin ComGF [Facklamia lactis]MBG9980967.1 prepilin-type N-terminal cleavage/methylation domain-containing protein [Facklamia lactis]MBG9986670.1 prepilin-type N-terminal cleavage/methylation domain-containing protein [Facklamia lactis]
MKSNYLKRFKSTQAAFTLIECLLALTILSLIMHGLMTSIQHYQKIDQEIRDDQYLEWQHFVLSIESELSQYKIESLSNQQIDISDSLERHYSIILKNQKIYKTPGHHPYLYHVKDWYVTANPPFIDITLEFTNGQIFSATLGGNFEH